ncbi:hypothetical protein CAL13_15455 [Bordetella genomosp. 9]|uniref:DUF2244 domain-containing protein n=2 Tax=Bordetella genomosp. 9 TaxID=1416803 RepID=A0A1W6Z288_9BORD|nr:hypothetical protein CAL13_15455 [Bordetella genomosp. 9]
MDRAVAGAFPYLRDAAGGEVRRGIMRDQRLRHEDGISASPPRTGGWDGVGRPSRRPRVWRLKRNCALLPSQYLASIALLMGLSAAVAISCWIRGLWVVPIFSCVELTAIGMAAFIYARHAVDGEIVTLTEDGRLRVEVDRGLLHSAYVFEPGRVRLIRTAAEPGRLWLCHGSTRIELCRYVQESVAQAFEADLRRALLS